MRYGYEPESRTDPAALWDDPTWLAADEATRVALRRQVVAEVRGSSGSGGGAMGAFLVAGAMLFGVALGRKKRR